MRIGSLCSGYGGLDHGVQSVYGGETVWVSDIDKGANKILAHRYPGVPNLGDFTALDWSAVEPVDVLTAGYPCQPFSHAGRRKGTEDARHLWPHVREAIRRLRPRLTFLENVAGHRSLGFDRVLGDLAEDGMHVRWTSIRAADIGAPHGRERLFILVARDADEPGLEGRWTAGERAGERAAGSPGVGPDLTLLPTPAVNDMGAGKTPEAWDEWTADMQARHGNGNGHGKSLAIEAQRLLPTPTSRDSAASGGSTPSDVTLTDAVVRTNLGEKENPRHAVPAEARPREELSSVREAARSEEVRQRPLGGSERLPEEGGLFAGVREHEERGHQGRAALAGAKAQGSGLSGLRNDEALARSPRGPEPSEQRSVEPDDALRELSSQVALAGGQGEAPSGEPVVDWGAYGPAIQRWEVVLGRPAPPPTILSKKGTPQLSARFVEWMQGLPAGWVTDVPGITRNEALKALGNGVCPQQAAAALAEMATWAVAA